VGVRRLGSSVAAAFLLIAGFARVASAFESGFVPPTEDSLKAAIGGGKLGAQLVHSLGKCDKKAAIAAFFGKQSTQDIENALAACQGEAQDIWQAKGSDGQAKPTTHECLKVKNLMSLYNDLDTILDRSAGLIACDGTAPLPGNLSGKVPSSKAAGKAEKKVLGNVRKLAKGVAVCRKKQATIVSGGGTYDEAPCESNAHTKYEAANATVTAAPSCLLDNLQLVQEKLDAIMKTQNTQVFCDGTVPFDAGGCCQQSGTCSNVTSGAACAGGTYQAGVTCSEATNRCQPSTCGIPSSCDVGEDSLNCPSDCFCGNGTCDSGESCSSCPTDCGSCPVCDRNCQPAGCVCPPGQTCSAEFGCG